MLPSLPRSGDLVCIRAERWRVSRCLTFADTVVVEADGCDAINRGLRARFLLPFEPVARIGHTTTARTVRPCHSGTVVMST